MELLGRRLFWIALGLSVFAAAGSATADIISPSQIDQYAYRLGLDPDPATVQQDRKSGTTTFSGTVIEACKLAHLGLVGVKAGERVEATSLKDSLWRIKLLSSGQEKVIRIRVGWGKKD